MLREAELGTQLRLLLHLLQGKRDVTSPLKCSTQLQRGYCPHFPCREQSTAHADCGRALGWPCPGRLHSGNQAPALKTAEVHRCSIALHFMPGRNIPLRQAKAGRPKPFFYLLSIFLLPKSPEKILYWSSPLHHSWGKTIGQNGSNLL